MNTDRTLIGYRIVRMNHGWREWIFHTEATEDSSSLPDWSRTVSWSTMYEPETKELQGAKKLAKKMGGRLVPVYLTVKNPIKEPSGCFLCDPQGSSCD